MSRCVKTGADCFIEEYDGVVRCDVHRFDDTIIIQYNPQSWDYDKRPEDADLVVRVAYGDGRGDGYHRKEDGTLVIPRRNVITTKPELQFL